MKERQSQKSKNIFACIGCMVRKGRGFSFLYFLKNSLQAGCMKTRDRIIKRRPLRESHGKSRYSFACFLFALSSQSLCTEVMFLLPRTAEIKDLPIQKTCSRKNFVFLFGAQINLTVIVVAYFHPMSMTYPIAHGPFFPGNIKMVKARQTLSS